jgi:hypothetical protein
MLASSSIIQDIQEMRKSRSASLAFFYCDYSDHQKKELCGLVSSLLVQLCHQSDSYFDILFNFYLEHGGGSRQPGDYDLVKCLKEILKLHGQPPIYLIIDALDECSVTVTSLVEDLMDSQISNLHICVTSRPEADIKATLVPLTFHSISLHDEGGQIEDIERYIEWFVNDNRTMRRWKEADKQLVIDALKKRADGM